MIRGTNRCLVLERAGWEMGLHEYRFFEVSVTKKSLSLSRMENSHSMTSALGLTRPAELLSSRLPWLCCR
jgi:hypothetical protein